MTPGPREILPTRFMDPACILHEQIPQGNADLNVFDTVTSQPFLSTNDGVWLSMDKRAPVVLATPFLTWKTVPPAPGAAGLAAPQLVAIVENPIMRSQCDFWDG